VQNLPHGTATHAEFLLQDGVLQQFPRLKDPVKDGLSKSIGDMRAHAFEVELIEGGVAIDRFQSKVYCKQLTE